MVFSLAETENHKGRHSRMFGVQNDRHDTRIGRLPSSGVTPFVGRTQELEQALRMLTDACSRYGHALVVSGPGGIGKTRFAEEVAALAQQLGAKVAIGRCWRDGEAPPLWPWRKILRELDAPPQLLSERRSDASPERFAYFEAVLEYFRTASRDTFYLLILDDAHLADPATLLLARFLARERQGLPLLLLLTRRDDTTSAAAELATVLAELDHDATLLALGGLTNSEITTYLSSCGCANVDAELVSLVGTVTKGNPLYLRSVVGRNQIGNGAALEGLDQVITHTIKQLSDLDQKMLGLAAVLGVEVSMYEVARLAEVALCVVGTSLRRAAALGLTVEPCGDRISFIHERVRDAALATLELQEQLAAHARAAQLLTGHTPDRALQRAHHAFIAASRSTADAITAVGIAREAAAALQRAGGFEQATSLLSRAIELHDAGALPEPVAALVVEWAEAVLSCGKLAEARPLFHRASQLAVAEENPLILARAALGLGGVWVREHRLTEEAERVHALQRRALDALPAAETVLRTRLSVRLAAENVYRGGPVAPVLAGVEAARRTGDAHALAEALSLCHHALFTPEYVTERLPLANEMIAVAAESGDNVLALIGLCWRAADLFLQGDSTAHLALSELRLRVDTLRCQSILFIVRAMEVMLMIRAGHFAQAEQAAAACYALGTEVGDADALPYYGAHLAAIRMFQGREAELTDLAASLAKSPAVTERDRAFSSAAALFALRGGQPHQAHALLDGLIRDGFESIIPTSSWLLTMQAVVEMAAELNDTQSAQAVYNALLPHAKLPIMASLAVVCFGSAHRPLGIAALAYGKIDLAIEHFEAAVAANGRLGHRPAAIQTRAELAFALLRRAGIGDDQRGRSLLEEALTEASALEMTGLVRRWQEALAKTQLTPVCLDASVVSVSSAPQGGWRVALGEHIATVPDLVGMRYLAQLVAAPNQDVPAVALVVDQGMTAPGNSGQEVMDATTLIAVRGRIQILRQQSMLTPDEQDELDALTHELVSASGLGGRIRSFADVPERARTAVRKAVKRAIEQISAANAVVGQHLAARIETGAVCRYRVENY